MKNVGKVFPSFLSTGPQKHQRVNIPVGRPCIKVLDELKIKITLLSPAVSFMLPLDLLMQPFSGNLLFVVGFLCLSLETVFHVTYEHLILLSPPPSQVPGSHVRGTHLANLAY